MNSQKYVNPYILFENLCKQYSWDKDQVIVCGRFDTTKL